MNNGYFTYHLGNGILFNKVWHTARRYVMWHIIHAIRFSNACNGMVGKKKEYIDAKNGDSRREISVLLLRPCKQYVAYSYSVQSFRSTPLRSDPFSQCTFYVCAVILLFVSRRPNVDSLGMRWFEKWHHLLYLSNLYLRSNFLIFCLLHSHSLKYYIPTFGHRINRVETNRACYHIGIRIENPISLIFRSWYW